MRGKDKKTGTMGAKEAISRKAGGNEIAREWKRLYDPRMEHICGIINAK